MKLSIIGGTGKTGRFVIKEAIRRKHDLKLLIRNSNKRFIPFKSDCQKCNCQIVSGDAMNYHDVLAAIKYGKTNHLEFVNTRPKTQLDFANNRVV